ncbi:MAG: type IV pilus secretin PilQ, partial [Rubrivivax sp.]|nr:type IV pilus secretin PilQ [Rubrivivax sp.]
TAAATAAGPGAGAQRVLSKPGSAPYDLKTNTLFVQDTPAKLREVREVLKKVDVPTRQVMIEARVVVADDTFGRALGARLTMGPIDANIGRTEFQNITATSNLDAPTGTGLATASSLAFQIVNQGANILLDLELQAMEADKRGKIVSNPRVITQNQKPAVILQGTQLPNVTPGTANSPATVTFKDAFLCLLVDPQILNNDNIILNVEVQKDAPAEYIPLGGGGVAYPIDTKRVKTQVRVKNGETAILGGIFEQTVRNDTNKVPLLGDIPVLGYLFKDNYKQDKKTELLIFLTPRILDDVALR